MLSSENIKLSFTLVVPNCDDSMLDKYAQQLIKEFREININAEPKRSEINPDGSKAIDPVIIGAILVTILPQMLQKSFDLLQSWIMRHQDQVIKIKYQAKNGSLVEIEIPSKMSQGDLNKYINMIVNSVPKSKK